MKIVNRGNIYDKANDRDYRNANPNGLTCITKEIYDFYFPYGKLCEDCPCNSGFGEPKCKDPENCRMKNHDCSNRKNKKQKKTKPVIETKVEGISNLEIFLSRSNLIWLYYNNIPFIFRTGKHNGVIQHHKDGNPLNDKPENISMIFSQTHKQLHPRELKLKSIIKNIEYLIRNYPDRVEQFNEWLNIVIELRNNVTNIETELGVWEIIDRECEELNNHEKKGNEKMKNEKNIFSLGEVLERVYEITRYGINVETDDHRMIDQVEFDKSVDWISKNLIPSEGNTINSYELKHIIESEVGQYIPNGAAIAGAVASNLRISFGYGPNADIFANYSDEAKKRISELKFA